MLFDYCRAGADLAAGGVVPMDLSMLGEGKGKKGKGDEKGKGQCKKKKGENNKGEKGKAEDRKGQGKGKANAKATTYFYGYCLHCKAWRHMKNDCWWNESVKNGKEASSQETSTVSAASTASEPSVTGMLIQSSDAEIGTSDSTQWLCSRTKREPNRIEDFLIDSGAATSVCQQSLVDSLGGKPGGPAIELRSATGHQFTTAGNTTICWCVSADGRHVSEGEAWVPWHQDADGIRARQC